MKKTIIFLGLAAVLGLGIFGLTAGGETEPQVNAVLAQKGDMEKTLELSGELTPDKTSSVSSAISGRITKVYVEAGDTVKKGDTLFEIDASELKLQEEEAKLNLEMLKEQDEVVSAMLNTGSKEEIDEDAIKEILAAAQTVGYDFEAFNDAIENGKTSSVSTSAIQSERKKELLELNLKTIQEKIAQCKVKSSMDGTVLNVGVVEGDTAAAGVKVMSIADTANMKVTGMVSEQDTKEIKTGMSTEITMKGDGKEYKGKVEKNGSQLVTISDTGSSEKMASLTICPVSAIGDIPGASADIAIVLQSKKNVLKIPLECLYKNSTVFVIDGEGVLSLRKVETGLRNEYDVEIANGLNEGEIVVKNPGKTLIEGQKVEIVDSAE